jgi:hypothetical protein
MLQIKTQLNTNNEHKKIRNPPESDYRRLRSRINTFVWWPEAKFGVTMEHGRRNRDSSQRPSYSRL